MPQPVVKEPEPGAQGGDCPPAERGIRLHRSIKKMAGAMEEKRKLKTV